jgi:pantoate--beta-alanine ligase
MMMSEANATNLPSGMRSLVPVRTVAGLREAVRAWRTAGQSVALVPTMGAIHEGHLSLVHAARTRCDRVIVSLFVNPKQFGVTEDIDSYPADEARDADLLERTGADLLFAPPVGEVYPDGFVTTVTVSHLTEGLCGRFRPGHFAGVTTVVTKLLLQAAPDIAVFGEKDYQQLLVVRRLVRDLDIPVDIVGVPTVRESDGLAVSSRNVYLSPVERQAAPALFRTLTAVAGRVAGGSTDCAEACAWGEDALRAAGFGPIDYLAVCDAATLETLSRADRPARVFAAARLGKARLIDNVAVQRT